MQKKNCAIYTRKSSADGLEQDFNSLDAQREASEAFITSQKHEGWQCSKTHYDDGAFSGGNLERPALQQLLKDIISGLIQVIIVYKVDRLTRSLTDFAKLVELFDEHGVSFVSVTQQFNTTSSMGRLTLNVLLSFAQFEREITGERIRDKLAASKQKGMWMGGFVPLGYDVVERQLVINSNEADTVHLIFSQYLKLKSVRALKKFLDALGVTSKLRINRAGTTTGGRPLSRGGLYKMLANPIYVGKIRHKENTYPGNHTALIEESIWEKVQALLEKNCQAAKNGLRAKHPSLLAGKLFDDNDNAMSPSHAVKNGKRYRYYISQANLQQQPEKAGSLSRVPAGEIESVVTKILKKLLADQIKLTDALNARTEEIESLIKQAAIFSHDHVMQRSPFRQLVKKVVLSEKMITLKISARALRNSLGLSPQEDPLPCITLSEKVRLKRCQGESRLILFGSNTDLEPKVNPSLVKAISRAYVWNQQLTNRKVSSIKEIAELDGFDGRYICQILPLAKLAPTIMNTILEGRQDPAITIGSLQKITSLDWSEQLQVFSS